VAVNPELANPLNSNTTQRLYELILFGNRQMNLTRITDPLEFWENTYGILYGNCILIKDEDKIDHPSKLSISAQERDSWDSGGGRSPERQLLCSIPLGRKSLFWKHYWQNSRLKT